MTGQETAVAAAMTEKDLQAHVLDMARWKGWTCYHTFDSRRSSPGFPDLVLVRSPRLAFAELKRAGGAVSTPQAHWLAELGRSSAEVYIWRPSDWLDGTIERVLS